jgi:rare lipoprotein A (peptidoglycan hydrolase)
VARDQGRIIDLSLASAERLKMVKSGIAKVKVEVLDAKRLPKT